MMPIIIGSATGLTCGTSGVQQVPSGGRGMPFGRSGYASVPGSARPSASGGPGGKFGER